MRRPTPKKPARPILHRIRPRKLFDSNVLRRRLQFAQCTE